MNRPTLRIGAGLALAAVAFFASAQDARQSFEVTGQKAPLPDAATMSAMTGEFRLSDGRVLRVLHPGLHLMAAVGSDHAKTIEPRGAHRFASRDGTLVVQFRPDADGRFDDLTLTQGRATVVASR